MAPRLNRWIGMTAVAAVVIAGILLTSGGSPLVPGDRGRWSWTSGESSSLNERIARTAAALKATQDTRRKLARRAQLAAVLAHRSDDPIVLRATDTGLEPVPAFTAVADSFWHTFPARHADVRTVIILGGHRSGFNFVREGLDRAGNCVLFVAGEHVDRDWLAKVRGFGGACIFAEQFGTPGKGWARWLAELTSGVEWDRPQDYWLVDRGPIQEGHRFPAWFEWSGFEYIGSGEWGWRPASRAYVACLAGRDSQCSSAFGATDAGWLDSHTRWGWLSARIMPAALLPKHLLDVLGPERFGSTWRSDSSVAVSYERVAGAPLNAWLGPWARGTDGPLERDNTLSLLAWIGVLFWAGALTILIAGRFRARGAS